MVTLVLATAGAASHSRGMRIGIDLGGTKIEGLVLRDDGTEHMRRRVPTPPAYGASLQAITALVANLEQDAESRCTVGLGIPGALTPLGVVKNANSTWLNGQPLAHDLEARLDREIRVANDADCFALSEAVDGAGAGAPVVYGVILGTGVGGGLVVHERVIQGPNRITGEWGHNPLPWPTDSERPGPACYCGRRGCVEAWLSGPAFSRDYAAIAGDELTAPQIVNAAAAGEPMALQALARYYDRLSRALATIINVIDPSVIVLGGGMSNVPHLAESVTERLSPWVFSDSVLTRVVANQHGDSSGVRGAAWLWPEKSGDAFHSAPSIR